MKKMIFTLFAAVAGMLSTFAQDDCIATLNHGTTLTTYTGEDALAQAYNAAADGDVITLSPGVFVAVETMKKAITLRGAGYKPMASNGYTSTQITGGFRVEIPSDGKSTFQMEGIDFLGDIYIVSDKKLPVMLTKSKFRSWVYCHGINLKATHCVFRELNADNSGSYNGSAIFRSTTLNCQNCVIGGAFSAGLNGTNVNKIQATNCVVKCSSNGDINNSTLINCIVISQSSSYRDSPLPETCVAHGCVGINGLDTPNIFSNLVDPSNVMVDGKGETAYAALFKTLKDVNSPSLYETFELTDAAKTTYLGEDGTQVGIYGGTAPFTLEPTNPQVTKFVVSSTTQGSQLKVKINVE